ncbi:MAG: hypothetical protein JOZ84_00615 [Methylobacteriaceae bacterium]|nr:hypothetical protein [Methylobacteriaceae bacterium]
METELYQPVKRFLEGLGFQVKGEIGGCDLVGLKADEPQILVIGELKLTFNLELVLQGVDRAAACDEVWLAVRAGPNGRGRENDRRVRKLCRRLGFGLLVVHARGGIEIVVSPEDRLPRRDLKRRSRLTAEHRKRRGDPTVGGGCRRPIMTAYRQQALACAAELCRGPLRVREVRAAVPDAPKILQGNVYGWFAGARRWITGPLSLTTVLSNNAHSLTRTHPASTSFGVGLHPSRSALERPRLAYIRQRACTSGDVGGDASAPPAPLDSVCSLPRPRSARQILLLRVASGIYRLRSRYGE